MKILQNILLGLFLVLLAFITAVISLYALDPDFKTSFNKHILNRPAEESVAAAEPAPEESAPPEVPQEVAAPEEAPSEAAAEESTTEEAIESKEEEEIVQDDSDGIDEGMQQEYHAPSEKRMEVPEELSDKTGYENLHVTEETVTDEEADRIEKELSTGPLGEDLDFDPEFYPYYSMLDDRGKALYRQIYANINEMNPAFRATDTLMTGKRIDSAFEAVFNDHPELFWIDTEYRTIYRKNGRFIELDLFYNDTAKNIAAARSEFNAAANAIILGAEGSDYEKERYVHNCLAELFEYERNPLDQSAYSGIVNNRTVCAGYARSFSHIMTKLKIPCYLCTGYAGEAHGWNIIKLDGEYYNVDVTWDDTGTDNPYYYAWFNKTDNDYSYTHIRKGLSVYLPPCRGTLYRNVEPDEPALLLHTLEEYGFTENDVIRDMQQYYDAMYRKILENGKGNYKIDLVISEDIAEQCNAAYQSSDIKDKAVSRALLEIGAAGANIQCEYEEIKGGYYLMSHTVKIS